MMLSLINTGINCKRKLSLFTCTDKNSKHQVSLFTDIPHKFLTHKLSHFTVAFSLLGLLIESTLSLNNLLEHKLQAQVITVYSNWQYFTHKLSVFIQTGTNNSMHKLSLFAMYRHKFHPKITTACMVPYTIHYINMIK